MKDDDNNANWSIGRRKFLAGTGVAAAGGLAGCMGGSGGSTSSGTQQASKGGSSSTQTETVTFVLTPSNPTEVRKNYLPMKKYLEANIDGLDVKFRVPTDYSAIRPALTSGQAEIAMDDITLMGIPNKVDVLGTTVTGGTAFYFSIIMTKPDSGIETLQDLKGKKIAFADTLSTSGSIYPLYELKQAGLDIGNAPTGKPVDFEGTWSNHKAAVQSLINDRADACATWGGQGLAYVPQSQFPPKAKQKSAYYGNAGSKTPHLQVINWSEPIPKQPFIARKTWDSPMKEKIDKALENSSKQKLSKYKPDDYNQTLTFTTLTDTSIEDYQPVIKRVNALGVDLTQG